MVYAECLLTFWESEILVHCRQSVPIYLAPNKNLGLLVSSRLPWAQILHICRWLFPAGESVLCMTPLWQGEGIRKPADGVL